MEKMSFVKQQYRAIISGRRQWRQFALILALVFLAVAGLAIRRDTAAGSIWLAPAALFGILAWWGPSWLEPVHRLWMLFAGALGFVMTRVILSIIFYLVLTPVALFSRLIGKRYLDLEFREERSSYWVERGEEFDRSASERQY
jgi:hypothetical protein